MKAKIQKVLEKCKELISKISRKTIVVTASVAVIGVAVLLNFILMGSGGDEGLKPAVDLTDLSALGNGDTDAVSEDDNYFATMALSRQQARDEALEVLQGVVDSEDAIEDMKTGAMEDIRRIAGEIEIEANIESLVMSKGFEQCVAVINGDSASVVVKSEGLLPNEISQISEIVYEQSGILPTNLNIIEKN
ncbi:MAG: SpoIIIAH-like family protein [Oscillospiraceae bacterium]|nr:SpoIIIAH-like family protein [Oscillospiraceae bacterium]